MKKRASNTLFLFTLLIFFNCSKKKHVLIKVDSKTVWQKNIPIDSLSMKSWYKKDLIFDTIPGISLERVSNDFLSKSKSTEVIVAIIDTEVDINHKEFKDKIWINKNEVPNNKIDDDNNGYIDDLNGWNFIGNLNNENIIYANLECVRIIQDFKKQLNYSDSITLIKSDKYNRYLEVDKYYKKVLKTAEEDKEYANFLFNGYPKAKASLKKLFPEEDYTLIELDSVYKSNKIKNKSLANDAYFLYDFIKYNLSEDWIKDYKKNADNKIAKTLNLQYYDRINIDKNSDNLGYIKYGNPFVNKNTEEFYHGTLIAGLIPLTKDSKIKIMPLPISSNGEEHDKDIALAIRYAVDNGAKVINMSFGKMFSLNKEWVFEALKYADKHDVLVVSSAGNSNLNLDLENNYYPNDNYNNEKEVSSNFLLVGATSHKLDKSFKSYFSNYGANDVDIFAPGENIYTTLPKDRYKNDSGTSLASAITSSVAAMVFSYYPNLKASEVKQILVDSGLEFTVEVATPTKEDKNKITPFNKLSKSGKVLNAYNALIMADSISIR